MQEADSACLKSLAQQPIATLATIHQGEPAVSMVPLALMPAGEIVIHVSSLASHTQDMLNNTSVALLLTAPLELAQTPLALPRLSINGSAQLYPRDAPNYPLARSVYLARFADAEELFNFSDFSLFVITPTSLRLVAGFGRAKTLTPEQFTKVLNTP